MDDVTDTPFRWLCKEQGADFVYTEFVAAESLTHNAKKSLQKIKINAYEHPIGIQLYGNDTATLQQAAIIVNAYHPDEININCGCPMKKIACKGRGAALLKDTDLLISLVRGVIEVTNIPVTVKTRLGWDEESIIIEDLVLRLQDVGVKKVIVHARTRAQMYGGTVRLEYLKKLKSNSNIQITIIGNGDVTDIASYEAMVSTGVDGVMIGRAAIGNPWIFNDIKNQNIRERTIEERFKMIKHHLNLCKDYADERYAVMMLKKHYASYLKNIHNSKELRLQLYTSTSIADITKSLDRFLLTN